MYLSRLLLNLRSREVRRDLSDCQDMHRTLLRCFPEATTGPARQEHGLLYRLETGCEGKAVLLVQSRSVPDWTRLPSGYLANGFRDANPVCKTMKPLMESIPGAGRFRFRLVANPTRDICVATEDGRKAERRVQLNGNGAWREWLVRKGELHGFRPLGLSTGPAKMNVAANAAGKMTGRRKGSTVTLAAVKFEGVLEVTDAGRFQEAVESGIGRGKAYGCGLLSVARV